MRARIRVDRDRLARFCQEHGIRRLSLFGSVLRDDFDPKRSDVDVLAEFDPSRTPDLFTMAGIQQDLSELFGRRVDLRSPGDLSRYFRQEVLDTADVQVPTAPILSVCDYGSKGWAENERALLLANYKLTRSRFPQA